MSGLRGWEATERMLESGGFESRQRVLVSQPAADSSESGARALGMTYWRAVAAATRGGVGATWRAEGGRLRLLRSLPLLEFGPPELEYGDRVVSCRYSIAGGLLTLRAGGSVTLAQVSDEHEHELSVTVREYFPRLAARAGAPRWTGVLYARAQSPFHVAVSRRYFQLLAQGSL